MTTRAPVDIDAILKALASPRRVQILEWLKDPLGYFPAQEHGDPIEHGTCNQFIADRLEVSQPAATRHMKVLEEAGLVFATRRKGWTYYRRNETVIDAFKARLSEF